MKNKLFISPLNQDSILEKKTSLGFKIRNFFRKQCVKVYLAGSGMARIEFMNCFSTKFNIQKLNIEITTNLYDADVVIIFESLKTQEEKKIVELVATKNSNLKKIISFGNEEIIKQNQIPIAMVQSRANCTPQGISYMMMKLIKTL